jgi:hypothetical protein
MIPERELNAQLEKMLRAIFDREVGRGEILKLHSGVSRFTLEQVRPELRMELDRRILASANLIKLNRDAAVRDTLQRFSGWATAQPPGGSRAAERAQARSKVRKALASLPFEERRVAIDQAHKFASNLSDILAQNAGAIAGKWRSNWRQVNYNYREDHKERDGNIYLIRDSWAHEKGLVRPGEAGYVDQITRPGEEVFCRCWYEYIYALRKLPREMLTGKGEAALREVQAA